MTPVEIDIVRSIDRRLMDIVRVLDKISGHLSSIVESLNAEDEDYEPENEAPTMHEFKCEHCEQTMTSTSPNWTGACIYCGRE